VVTRLPAPSFESRCEQKCVFSRKSLRYAALSTGCRPTLTAVPRSTQPSNSTLRGTVNAYQPYGWVIIPVAMGECSAYSRLQAGSKVKFAAWTTSWRPPGADRLWPIDWSTNSLIYAVHVDTSSEFTFFCTRFRFLHRSNCYFFSASIVGQLYHCVTSSKHRFIHRMLLFAVLRLNPESYCPPPPLFSVKL